MRMNAEMSQTKVQKCMWQNWYVWTDELNQVQDKRTPSQQKVVLTFQHKTFALYKVVQVYLPTA